MPDWLFSQFVRIMMVANTMPQRVICVSETSRVEISRIVEV